MNTPPPTPADVPPHVAAELHRLADAFGDPRWAQGPGGNVSVKDGEILWIKASGTRLAEVAYAPNHVGVPLIDAEKALAGDAGADARVFACNPRPSLETYFHALQGVVVAHTHPVSAILAACAARDLGVAFDLRVPYERPGRGLAVSIAKQLIHRTAFASVTSVLLESHGLLVYAPTAEEAIAESQRIDRECLTAARADVESFDDLVARYKSTPIGVAGGVALRLPPRALPPDRTEPRYLFPDAVVYASTVPVVKANEDTGARALAELGRAIVLAGNDGERLAVAKTASSLAACVEILAAHDWVEDQLVHHANAPGARYLPDDEPAKILGLPSEQHRLRLANA